MDVLPLPAATRVQPHPARTKYSHHGPDVTAILRTWPGVEAAGACRLCPRGRCCVDAHAQCLIVVGRHVPAADCPLFSEAEAASAPEVGVDARPALDILAM